MNQRSTRLLTYIAIGAALTAVLSQIILPLGPVPFTLQTLSIGLIATLYKPREAIFSVSAYLLLGAIGLPVFAGGNGGFHALFGATGGFLWAFILYALVTSFLSNIHSSFWTILGANCLGVTLVLLGGATYFKFFNQATWSDSLAWTVIPFILTSVLQIIAITLIVQALQPVLKKEAYFK